MLHAVQQRSGVGHRRGRRIGRCRPAGGRRQHVVGVLADHRRGHAHRTRCERELHRGRDLLHRAEHGIVDGDHHAVVASLRRVVHLGRTQVLDHAHIGIEEPLHPLRPRPGLEDVDQLELEDRDLLIGQRHAHVHAVGAGWHAVVDAEHAHRAAERADGTGVQSQVLAVAAFERARHESHPGRRLERERRVTLTRSTRRSRPTAWSGRRGRRRTATSGRGDRTPSSRARRSAASAPRTASDAAPMLAKGNPRYTGPSRCATWSDMLPSTACTMGS